MNSLSYTPNEIALAYPISVRKILHFVSQDSVLAQTFIEDILCQHIELLEEKGYDKDSIQDAYGMLEYIRMDIHNASAIAHQMALQQPFIESEIDNSFNYIMTLLANGSPIPYDTPEIYIRVWSEKDTLPKYTPIMGRKTGFYKLNYTTNRLRGFPNYPEYIHYEDEDFLEKLVVDRQPPAAPITYRKKNLRLDANTDYTKLNCYRRLEDTFDEMFNLIEFDSLDENDFTEFIEIA